MPSAAALPSILVSGVSRYTDRELSGAGVGGAQRSGHVIFARLVGWSTWCVAALVGSDIIPSMSVCVWGCVAGVPTVLLSIIAMQVDMRTEVLFQ